MSSGGPGDAGGERTRRRIVRLRAPRRHCRRGGSGGGVPGERRAGSAGCTGTRRAASLLAACLFLSLAAAPGWAGTAGRIAGRVLDGKKQPLAGANVAMLGVQLGTVSDENGQFNIINIP